MKRMMCLLLIILCMVISAASSSAFTLQRSRIYQSADDSGAYKIRIDGQHAEITKYLTGSFSVGLNLSHTICAACAYHGKAVLFCPDDHNNQLIIYVYDLATDYLDSFAVYGMKLLDNTDFGCDDSAIYIENYRDSRELLAYSYSGNLLDRYRFNSEINAVCGAYDSGTYIVSGNELNIIRSGSVHVVTGGEVHAPLFPADFGMIASAYGQVYRLDGDRIASSFSVETDYKAVSACVIGHTLYYPCGNTIDGYDLDTGEKTSYYTLNENASLLYADADRIVDHVKGGLCGLRKALAPAFFPHAVFRFDAGQQMLDRIHAKGFFHIMADRFYFFQQVIFHLDHGRKMRPVDRFIHSQFLRIL